MLAILSPAKTLDFESPVPTDRHSQPVFLDEARELVRVLRKFDEGELAALMGISAKLAALNVERFRTWKPPFSLDNARQALFAYDGDVYQGFDLRAYDGPDFDYAQEHLRILSGLHGVLKPLDLIQPHRLEMSTPLVSKRGRNLYEFWGGTIAEALNAAVASSGTGMLVNLASQEYFAAVDPGRLRARVITPVFKDARNGGYQIISFFAKKARGTMADYLIRQRVTTLEKLKKFRGMGYAWNRSLSRSDELVFTRDKA